ncbi:MAG: HNH endonuclease [Proteobacteria bacterium]|nr:HNH endonuclease [Pseudomonadota bacterium]
MKDTSSQTDSLDAAFWQPRTCMRAPISEIFHAAHLLDRATSAHLSGHHQIAEQLIHDANIPTIRNWTESLWGSLEENPEQPKFRRFREVPDSPPYLKKSERAQERMPSDTRKEDITQVYGRHCLFCGIPLIHENVRKAMHSAYPIAACWGSSNQTQHAALQCMWLQFDHILPHSRGGDNSIENVVVTCAPCNYGRKEYTLDEVGLIDPRTRPILRTSWDGLERFLQPGISQSR